MADQAERVILEAEDPVLDRSARPTPALDSFEKKAESSHGKVIRISDQTRSSVQRLIASLEKQAETYGKSGVDRLITQRDQLLQRYSREPQAIDAITKSYEKMIAEQKKIELGGEVRRVRREGSSQFIENPLAGAKGAVTSALDRHGTVRRARSRPARRPRRHRACRRSRQPRVSANTACESRMWNCARA